MSESAPKRYHPVHVILHWLIAIFVIFIVLSGTFVMSPMQNSAEVPLLGLHSLFGKVIGLLIIVRLITRFFFKRPKPADAGHPLLNYLSSAVHLLLYIGVFAMMFSGGALSMAYNLDGVLKGSVAIPEDLFIFQPRFIHGILGNSMLALILLHFGAAMYHQFIKKDNLLSRMWFGK